MYVASDMNKQRADVARQALHVYISWNFSLHDLDADLGSIHPDDVLASCSDLIANILHFAVQQNFNPEEIKNIIPRACMHFEAEQDGEE